MTRPYPRLVLAQCSELPGYDNKVKEDDYVSGCLQIKSHLSELSLHMVNTSKGYLAIASGNVLNQLQD